jgi:ZIP family zinc transporter
MKIILFSAVAGILGMGLGSVISAILYKKSTDALLCWMLSFAGGVMVSIVCFGLIPEAFVHIDTFAVIGSLIMGIILIMGLNRLLDIVTGLRNGDHKVHKTHEELNHQGDIIRNRQRSLFKSGLLMLFAIGFHNIPEGIAIGAGGSHDFQLGVLLTLMILLHNIPEGMAIATPLMLGGIKRWRVVLVTSLCGATTLLGGLIGVYIGGISEQTVALSLSIAGGAMLYIVFGEIIPQSVVMTKNRTAPIVTLFGIIMGLLVTRI